MLKTLIDTHFWCLSWWHLHLCIPLGNELELVKYKNHSKEAIQKSKQPESWPIKNGYVVDPNPCVIQVHSPFHEGPWGFLGKIKYTTHQISMNQRSMVIKNWICPVQKMWYFSCAVSFHFSRCIFFTSNSTKMQLHSRLKTSKRSKSLDVNGLLLKGRSRYKHLHPNHLPSFKVTWRP